LRKLSILDSATSCSLDLFVLVGMGRPDWPDAGLLPLKRPTDTREMTEVPQGPARDLQAVQGDAWRRGRSSARHYEFGRLRILNTR
jgi:hypothetical protein